MREGFWGPSFRWVTAVNDKLRPFLHSLGVRLLIPLFLTVGVVLTIHATISFRSTKEHFLQFVEADVNVTLLPLAQKPLGAPW